MSMTALVSAFARAYHTRREGAKIFDDKYARLLLSTEEHEQIGAHMASGVSFFDPAFRGDAGDALSGCIGSPSGRSDEGGVRQRHPGPYGAILRPALYLTPQDIQARFFDPYNAEAEGCPMYAPADVAYCVLTRA